MNYIIEITGPDAKFITETFDEFWSRRGAVEFVSFLENRCCETDGDNVDDLIENNTIIGYRDFDTRNLK